MQNFLLIIQVVIAVALVAVILVQRTAQDGGGLTGGGSTMGGLFTARGSANLLTRATAFLATLFIVNSLVLAALASSQHQNASVIDSIAPIAVPAVATPASSLEGKTPEKVPLEPQVPLAK